MAGIKFNGAEVFKSSLQKPESYLVSSVGRVSHSRTLGKYFLLKKTCLGFKDSYWLFQVKSCDLMPTVRRLIFQSSVNHTDNII